MSFFNKISALIPFTKKTEELEYFFALNISFEKLTAALWTIDGKELKILEIAEKAYLENSQIANITDVLLDEVLGMRQIEPQKILFGIPNSWLSDDNLKDEYLKLLRGLVKDLDLIPMAYVATTSAVNHLLEKKEGIPQTGILVEFEKKHLTVTVTRAGKIDGVKILERGETAGADIEKALLTFTEIETLPSKILLYGLEKSSLEKLKSQLLSFSWMARLSFLHFPKIEVLADYLDIKSICFAGAAELEENARFVEKAFKKKDEVVMELKEDEIENLERHEKEPRSKRVEISKAGDNFGFVVGDVSESVSEEEPEHELVKSAPSEYAPSISSKNELNFFGKIKTLGRGIIPKGNRKIVTGIFGVIGVVIVLIGAYLVLVKAQVKVFVEPKILEKDTQVIADPKQKEVLEENRIIPGQIVVTEVSGTAKEQATGTRQIGDSAKGTVIIYNKTNESVNISKGSVLTGPGSAKFTLDLSVSIASQEARIDGISFGKATVTVTAQEVGADGNIPSGADLTVSNFSNSQISAKSEGNFAGGTSKEVTVVSSEDQKRLLASLASNLRRQAQQKLQEENLEKKILEEALSEQILNKNYSKNVNDQANDFSLNMTIRFKGTAFEDKDLKGIVGKLVTTDVPEGFELNLQDTETQADVAKLESDGRLIFLAKFRAKLMPKIDTEQIKDQIRGRTVDEAVEKLKGMENILGSEFQITPTLPSFLQRLPILKNNITLEVGLK